MKKKYMKRFGIISGLALAALALTNCAKEVDTTNETLTKKEGVPFSIIAMPSDATKTVMGTGDDNMKTKWELTDAVNLFHADAGGTSYTSDGRFGITDTETGQFDGTVASSPVVGTAYDWYAIYPYDQYLTEINETNGTNRYFTLGSTKTGTQTQASPGSTAHLAGTHMPLYGIKKNATYNGSAPIIQMNQFASVAAVTITNKTSADINVSNIEFTAPEYVVGTFYLDILGETVNFTPSTNSAGTTIYASETAKLTVTDGTLAKDDVGVFYIAIKPFTAHSGDVISLKVTTDAGDSQTKEFNLDRDYTFAAGKMKTVKMNFTKEHQDLSGTYYQITSVDDITADGYYMIVMPDVSVTPNEYLVVTAGKKDSDLHPVLNSGFAKDDDGLLSYTAPEDVYIWGIHDVVNGALNFRNTDGDIWRGISYPSSGSDVKTNSASNGYWTPTLLSSGCFQLTNSNSRFLSRGTTDKITAYLTSGTKFDQVATGAARGQYACAWAILKLGAAPTSTPKIMDAVASDLSPRGSAANTVNVTKKNTESAIKILSYDGTVVTAASISGNTVTFTTANNYTSSARTGTITVALVDDETVTGTITVNQLASEFHLPNNETSAAKQVGAAANSTVTIQVTSDFDWTIDATNLNGATATPATFTYLDTKTQTVTIKATSANTTSSTKDLGSFKIVRTADNAELTVTVSQKDAKLSAPTVSDVAWSDKPTLKATATWSSVTNASSYAYKVEYDNGNSFIAETSANGTSAVFTIAADTAYNIYVKAVGDGTNWFDSDWSAAYSFNLPSAAENNFTWDLTIADYASATEELVTWSNANATMTWEKNGGTKVNNYLNSGTPIHSRIYSSNIWTFTPASGVTITKVEIIATQGASALAGYTWTNASASYSGTTVTLTPTSGTSAFSATMGTTIRITGVTVYYTGGGSTPITVATPTFNPAGGTYTSTQNVTISCSTTGATIKYTTDNSDPSSSNGSTYSSAISISTTTTLKAIAIKDGVSSEVATATYTINSSGSSTLLSEDFSSLTTWSTSAFSSLSLDSGTWTASGSVYTQVGCIKLGKSSAAENTISLPALSGLSTTKTVKLKFKAVSSVSNYPLTITATNAGTVSGTATVYKHSSAINSGATTAAELANAFSNASFQEITIANASSSTVITIKTTDSSKQWYIDDVSVEVVN